MGKIEEMRELIEEARQIADAHEADSLSVSPEAEEAAIVESLMAELQAQQARLAPNSASDEVVLPGRETAAPAPVPPRPAPAPIPTDPEGDN